MGRGWKGVAKSERRASKEKIHVEKRVQETAGGLACSRPRSSGEARVGYASSNVNRGKDGRDIYACSEGGDMLAICEHSRRRGFDV